jgi:hypothetical protein
MLQAPPTILEQVMAIRGFIIQLPYAFTGHRICVVVGHLKYKRSFARPRPCICGTL